MNPKATFLLLPSAVAAFLFLSQSGFAQQKPDDQAKAKKTITIHVTKEVNGDAVVIDTTIVTEGEFDADAFLKERGVMNDMPNGGENVEKHVIIRHPGTREYSWSESDNNSPDSISINDKQVFIFKGNKDLLDVPQEGLPSDFYFNMPRDFHHMQGPRFEDMLEGMLETFGLDNVMPFGEMKQVVVKKKRNGRKVIITFEDRKNDDAEQEHEQGNRKKKENVIIYRNGDQGSIPQNEERVMVKGKPGENIIIHKTVKKTENGDQIIINAEVEQPKSVKTEKKVIIITEDGN